jgi:hypothetical protein
MFQLFSEALCALSVATNLFITNNKKVSISLNPKPVTSTLANHLILSPRFTAVIVFRIDLKNRQVADGRGSLQVRNVPSK